MLCRASGDAARLLIVIWRLGARVVVEARRTAPEASSLPYSLLEPA